MDGEHQPWVCPWAICNHEQAQACRADTKASRGCGGRFLSTTTPEQAREMVRRTPGVNPSDKEQT